MTPPPTGLYTLSLHDALPILPPGSGGKLAFGPDGRTLATATGSHLLFWELTTGTENRRDRKSTRLNSSHTVISYAVFCLKKKKKRPIVAEAWIKSSAMHYSEN